MSLLLVFCLLLILLFGLVVFFGAPYLPTFKKQIETALDLLDLQPGQTMLELGSGDGRVLRAAAIRGLNAIGYELNPILVVISKLRCWPYRGKVRVIWANYWLQKWPQAEGIFVFLLPKYMNKLDKKIIQYQQDLVKQGSLEAPAIGHSSNKAVHKERTAKLARPGRANSGDYKHKPVKLVSFAFRVPGKKASATKNGVYRYEYN